MVEEKVEKYIPIMADLTGPTIRTGDIEEEFEIRKGGKVMIVCATKAKNSIPLANKRVFSLIEEDDIILIDNGKLVLRVEEVGLNGITATALNDGIMKSRRTFAIKGKEPPLPAITDKDRRDIEFCIENKVDYIALSFVREVEDVLALRDILDEKGGEDIRIVAKIKTASAVKNIESILSKSDAALIARGDLGMFYPLEEIPDLQSMLTKKCRSLGKPVILATQLLESMIENPVPTRSEVVDVMTAVREGVDALMLAGETSIGKYPVEAVRWLRRIIEASEKHPPEIVEGVNETLYDKFAKGVVLLAGSLGAYITAYTRKGNTAMRLSRYRPIQGVLAFTSNPRVARQLSMLWGVEPFYIDVEEGGDLWSTIIDVLKERGVVGYGDIVIMTIGMKPGTTDMLRIETIK